MLNLPLTLRRLRVARNRATALAVMVMQLLVAASAIWEPRAQVRLGAHAEQQGTRHVGQHNEATCALCSVRTQASMPSAPEQTAVSEMRAVGPVTVPVPPPVATRLTPTLSRAPPPLPA